MIYIYNIAGISCSISGGPPRPFWRAFEVPSLDEPDFSVTFLSPSFIGHGLEEIPLTGQPSRCYRHGQELMLVNRDWSAAQILPLHKPEMAETFLTQVFDAHAARREMLHIHCAVIRYKGAGVLFLGPSGIGKTTQAERWRDFRSAAILNGDMGYVQRTKNGFLAWGTPWHGSSPYCENESVPLKALVVLKQAPENTLRELSGYEKVREVSGSVFYPNWAEDGVELCLGTLDSLLKEIPVYRLDNRADEGAVALLENELERRLLI